MTIINFINILIMGVLLCQIVHFHNLQEKWKEAHKDPDIMDEWINNVVISVWNAWDLPTNEKTQAAFDLMVEEGFIKSVKRSVDRKGQINYKVIMAEYDNDINLEFTFEKVDDNE